MVSKAKQSSGFDWTTVVRAYVPQQQQQTSETEGLGKARQGKARAPQPAVLWHRYTTHFMSNKLATVSPASILPPAGREARPAIPLYCILSGLEGSIGFRGG